jgi:hypothetical protein
MILDIIGREGIAGRLCHQGTHGMSSILIEPNVFYTLEEVAARLRVSRRRRSV